MNGLFDGLFLWLTGIVEAFRLVWDDFGVWLTGLFS